MSIVFKAESKLKPEDKICFVKKKYLGVFTVQTQQQYIEDVKNVHI